MIASRATLRAIARDLHRRGKERSADDVEKRLREVAREVRERLSAHGYDFGHISDRELLDRCGRLLLIDVLAGGGA